MKHHQLHSTIVDHFTAQAISSAYEANMKLENTISDLRLIDKSELRELLAWSDASIDRQVRTDPLFPQPLRLGQNSIRWRLEEVIRHINGLPRVCYEDHAFDPNSGAGSVKW